MTFSHLVAKINSSDLIPDLCHQMLSFLLKLELTLQKHIGYNIILTQSYLLIVPLINNYDSYDGKNLYLDGLASIGVVDIPKLNSPFMVEKKKMLSPYEYVEKSFGKLEDIETIIDS